MGAWGTRIYEDDTALDIRGDFLEHFHAGEAMNEIEATIKEEYFEEDTSEITDVAILALACAELEVGQLSDGTKAAALEVIVSGRQYDYWKQEATPAEAGRRKRELTRIKSYLDDYDGMPVKRKSWTALQKDDPKQDAASDADELDDEDDGERLDNVSWHMQDEGEGLSDDEYYARHATTVALVLHWAVRRGYASERLAKDADTGRYKRGEITIFQYIEAMIDGKLYSSDIKSGPARDFMSTYYLGAYYDDIQKHVSKERADYSFRVTPAELDDMATVIDARFKEYTNNPEVFIAVNHQPKNKSVAKIVTTALLIAAIVGVVIWTR